jgi:hypothetical protein
MVSRHRLVDPITEVLSFTASETDRPLDLRRLKRLEGAELPLPWTLSALPPDAPPPVTLG